MTHSVWVYVLDGMGASTVDTARAKSLAAMLHMQEIDRTPLPAPLHRSDVVCCGTRSTSWILVAPHTCASTDSPPCTILTSNFSRWTGQGNSAGHRRPRRTGVKPLLAKELHPLLTIERCATLSPFEKVCMSIAAENVLDGGGVFATPSIWTSWPEPAGSCVTVGWSLGTVWTLEPTC